MKLIKQKYYNAKGEEKVLSTTEDGVRVSYIAMDSNLKEILKNIEKTNNASKEEVGKLAKEALDSINFVDKIDEINLEFDKYVIFTDGNEHLVYENGEFFVVSTTDVNKKREKKKKEEAKNMYLEYFIRYILNPIIKPIINIKIIPISNTFIIFPLFFFYTLFYYNLFLIIML